MAQTQLNGTLWQNQQKNFGLWLVSTHLCSDGAREDFINLCLFFREINFTKNFVKMINLWFFLWNQFHEKFRENDLGRLNKLSNFAPACTDSTQHTVAAAPYFFSMRFPWKWRLIEWSIVCVHKKLNSTRGNICRLETRKKNQMKMMATILEGHKPNKTSTNKHLYLVPTSTHLQTLIFYRNYTYLHTYLNLMKCPNRC